MPFNSFENYPMSWLPDRTSLFAPLYISLAEQLEGDIQRGKLANNTKLPPQRELADYLDVSLSTVTRAYLLCAKKGLVRGRTGSGTYVSFNVGSPRSVLRKPDKQEQIQMGTVYPFYV
ncbi:MAG: GntR family transcriptional regulator, partial [Candidatus Moranbacteria bacterium]|nr:GntR family transcriptional regulator [Candidatus Moranbacteria bacterium]